MKFSSRFVNSLPDGVRPEDVRILHCTASLLPDANLTDKEEFILSSLTEAAQVPLTGADGKPSVMKVVAWMAHEGPNRNRQAFVAPELQQIAPALFRAPNFGVMDWNHSAVAFSSDEPHMIGVWYNATYSYDKAADKWGILATGMLFSWLFPDQATSLLADQARVGTMQFSMACIPGSVESAKDDKGYYEILHNPTFFTVSALDVPPADQYAQGTGTEDPSVTTEQLREKLLAVATIKPLQSTYSGGTMNQEQIDQMKRENAEAAQKYEELRVKHLADSTKADELAASLTEVKTTLATAQLKIAELEQALETAKAEKADVLTAKEAAIQERDAALATLQTVEATVAELRVIVDEVNASKAATAKKELIAKRIAALPEFYRKVHEAKTAEEKESAEVRWGGMSEEAFETFVTKDLAGLSTASNRPSFLDRSLETAALPTAGGSTDAYSGIARLARKQ